MAMNAMTPFAQREVCDLVFVDYFTKKPILNLDWANANGVELSAESVFAYGGQGHPKRVQFTGNKEAQLTLETQLQNYQLYSIVTGAAIENTAKFLQREEVTATEDGTLTLVKGTPVGNVNVFAADDDCGVELEGATIVDGAVVCDDIIADASYVVYYMKEFTDGVQKINIKGSTFAKAVEIYASTVGKTEDDQIVAMKMIVYKAVADTNLSWSFANDGDPITLSITFQVMANENGDMIDMIMAGEDE